jgi:Spy/CpxP family protein refolding chaperone
MSGDSLDPTPGDGTATVATRRPSRARVVALLTVGILLVAAAGVASGVVLERRVLSRHDGSPRAAWRRGDPHGGSPRAMHERFGRDLDLTPAQSARIDSIFASHRAAIDSARAVSEPTIRAIIDQTRREIDSVLTPAQREKMHARMQREHPPGGPGRPF